jgi:hypothetical protein
MLFWIFHIGIAFGVKIFADSQPAVLLTTYQNPPKSFKILNRKVHTFALLFPGNKPAPGLTSRPQANTVSC